VLCRSSAAALPPLLPISKFRLRRLATLGEDGRFKAFPSFPGSQSLRHLGGRLAFGLETCQ
jgi:hypothetical protein